jgi:hypothetical protein
MLIGFIEYQLYYFKKFIITIKYLKFLIKFIPLN